MPIPARYTADASVACQENTVADGSEAQRMRLRLGSVFEELVALRQAALASRTCSTAQPDSDNRGPKRYRAPPARRDPMKG